MARRVGVVGSLSRTEAPLPLSHRGPGYRLPRETSQVTPLPSLACGEGESRG